MLARTRALTHSLLAPGVVLAGLLLAAPRPSK
jgi:hypothetical protein